MKTITTLLFLLLLNLNANASVCTWKVEFTNGATGEIKSYKPNNNWLEVPVNYVSGFNVCKISPVQEFKFWGIPTSRIDIYCYTVNGEVFAVGSVANRVAGPGIEVFQLLGKPVEIIEKDGKRNINASGNVEINTGCTN